MLFSAALFSGFLISTQLWVVSANGRDQQPPDLHDDIINQWNQRYTTSVTLAGQTVNMGLDTGSTDMWIAPLKGINSFESTGVSHKITYGSVYINGTIGLGTVEVAGHTIPKQAFINVTQMSLTVHFVDSILRVGAVQSGGGIGASECVSSGVCGIFSLGFDSPTAGIEAVLTKAGQDGPAVGKPVLSSVFDMNPDKGRFFAVSFSRLGDEKDTADASLTVSEYDDNNVKELAHSV
ncbi:hypothetical protein B0H10DRAFT_1963208 [Mycena sp. CBHHK59/15]|nr:hypothetical protein B0H10DRAFT_1963208 [Mycena sp. CBHHK59/15]